MTPGGRRPRHAQSRTSRSRFAATCSNLHSECPDDLLRVILDAIREPKTKDIGFMPAFRDHLDDAQLGQLAAHMRQRFAPDKPAWQSLERLVARVRAALPH